jgi:hypothetical protein
MLKQITAKYNDPQNTQTFDDFNSVYAEKIKKKFSKLNEDSVHNPEFYNTYFKDFGTKSLEISKLFSVLKHK